jgi:hypothetical protein
MCGMSLVEPPDPGAIMRPIAMDSSRNPGLIAGSPRRFEV